MFSCPSRDFAPPAKIIVANVRQNPRLEIFMSGNTQDNTISFSTERLAHDLRDSAEPALPPTYWPCAECLFTLPPRFRERKAV